MGVFLTLDQFPITWHHILRGRGNWRILAGLQLAWVLQCILCYINVCPY